VEEPRPADPHVVQAATTSVAAFPGVFPSGPVGEAVLVGSWDEFVSQYGGLSEDSSLAAFAVWQFFQNGGTSAYIVRLDSGVMTHASAKVGGIVLTALSPGAALNGTSVTFRPSSDLGATPPAVDLVTTAADSTAVETLTGLPSAPADLASGITNGSKHFSAAVDSGGGTRATAAADSPSYQFPASATLAHGNDGSWDPTALKDALLAQFGDPPVPPVPVPALDQIAPSVFNLMCVPDAIWLEEADQISVLKVAQRYCQKHQAFLIVDTPAPSTATPSSSMFGKPTFTVPPLGDDVAREAFLKTDWTNDLFGVDWFCGAAYYPWVTIPNPTPTPGGQPMAVPPSGTVAGVYAATDEARKVWKAPAGTAAGLSGVLELLDKTMSDDVNADLNSQGINCLRNFEIYGNVVWGARTMAGADLLESGWKYVPVRRTADFIEQSLLQSLKWTVFEPNAAPLWASISLEVDAFMNALYGQGAFGGTTAAEAYQLVCDGTTTSPTDQLAGVVNVFVGFRPVGPAEFVVLTVQLNAGPPPAAS